MLSVFVLFVVSLSLFLLDAVGAWLLWVSFLSSALCASYAIYRNLQWYAHVSPDVVCKKESKVKDIASVYRTQDVKAFNSILGNILDDKISSDDYPLRKDDFDDVSDDSVEDLPEFSSLNVINSIIGADDEGDGSDDNFIGDASRVISPSNVNEHDVEDALDLIDNLLTGDAHIQDHAHWRLKGKQRHVFYDITLWCP